jgi:hypothetical protein
VLALKSVVRVGNHFGFRVGVLKSHNIDCRPGARPETCIAGSGAASYKSKIEKVLKGAAQIVWWFVRLGQHHSTLRAFAEPQLNAMMR